MALPKVIITQTNGNLGRTTESEDGISLLIASGAAVGGSFALNDILGPFTSLKDAEDLGIDSAYDTTNTCMVWHHVRDFYAECDALGVKGVPLYVQVVAKTVLMATMTDNTSTTYIKKVLQTANGAIRLVGVSRIPDGGYTPTYTNQIEADILTALTNLQTMWAAEQILHRPFQAIVEGRNWQGTVSSSQDLRLLTDPRVSVVIAQDSDVAAENAAYAKYAAVGAALGRAAAIAVSQNIGRVKDGALASIVDPGFSNGGSLESLTDANLDSMNDKGYIFGRTHIGKAGVYFNDNHCAVAATDDFAYMSDGRVMDKADRIAYSVYVDELLDNVEVDTTTGKLAPTVIKNFQGLIEKAINQQMGGEISGVTAYCDPNQDVLGTSKIVVQVNITPLGTSRTIEATLQFDNPNN